MKSIRFRFFVAALAVTLGAAISKAQTADTSAPAPHEHAIHDHGFGMEGHMMGFFAKQLDLTDAQRTQMKGVMKKEHDNMRLLLQLRHQNDHQLRLYIVCAYNETKHMTLASQ